MIIAEEVSLGYFILHCWLSRALESSSFSINDAASFINLWDVDFIRPDHHSNIVLDFLINSSEYSLFNPVPTNKVSMR